MRAAKLSDEEFDLHEMANITEGFSGADITEVCQRACKLAIRGEIAEQEAAEAAAIAAGKDLPEPKLDGKLGKKQFDEAMLTARKSVSKTELARYLKFKKELSGGQGLKQAMASVEEDSSPEAPASSASSSEEENEELYD